MNYTYLLPHFAFSLIIKIMLQDSDIFLLWALAQELGVEELWRSCEEHVSATLSPANACAFLSAAIEAQERVFGES